MAEAIMRGIVTGVVDESPTVSRLVVTSPAIDGGHVTIIYEPHHAQRLLQLYGGRPVAVMENNGRRWIRAMSQPVEAAVVEVEAYAQRVAASLRTFAEERTFDSGHLRNVVARNLSVTDAGVQTERDQCPIYCTLPQHDQMEVLACVGWWRLTDKQ